jgi:hypothetical protein
MKLGFFASTFLAALAAAGCYESPVPLAPASEAVVDARLLGLWERLPGGGDGREDLLILRFNERELYARCQEAGDEPGHFRAWVASLDGVHFLNVQSLEEADPERRSFCFFMYEIGPDSVLALRMVSDRLFDEKPSDPAKLRRFMAKHLRDEALYESPDRFRRVVEDS